MSAGNGVSAGRVHVEIMEEWLQLLLPFLRTFVGNALNRKINVFVDRTGISAGDSWPLALRHALAHSRILLAIWSPLYFHSPWCRRECAIMMHRERKLGFRTAAQPRGLIVPVNVFDGDFFPDPARRIEWLDCREFWIVGDGFKRTVSDEHLQPRPARNFSFTGLEWRMGQIVTFYSYKGGVGRSMALANVATLLVQWGYRVLAVDFDLEAPGLEAFFSGFIDSERLRSMPGMIEFLLDASSGRHSTPNGAPQETLRIRLPRSNGLLSLVRAGHRDEEGYFKKVRQLDLREFYESADGGAIIERIRNYWKQQYDFVLVDSRTGLTDIGGLCTVQLPDFIVLFFTATDQALLGGVEMMKRAGIARQRLPFSRSHVHVVPIPSRLDSSEFRLSQQWLDRFERELSGEYASWIPQSVRPRTLMEMTKLPHVAFFSYGETLPVVEQGTKDPAGLGYAYENLAALLAKNLQEIETFVENRDSYIKSLVRNGSPRPEATGEAQIFISYHHSDRKWLDRLEKHLGVLTRSRALTLWDDRQIKAGENWRNSIIDALNSASVAVLLVSPDYLASDWVQREELPHLLKAAEERGLQSYGYRSGRACFQRVRSADFKLLPTPASLFQV